MIASILAVDEKGCIWKNNSLCWHLKQDLKFFSEKTKNSVVIMWRNTYLSLPKQFRPLPGRINIVLTRNEFDDQNIIVSNSIQDALEKAGKYNKDIFFIGGKSVYEKALDFVDKVFLTKVYWKFDCDVCLSDEFFKKLNDNFFVSDSSDFFEEKGIKFKFIEYGVK